MEKRDDREELDEEAKVETGVRELAVDMEPDEGVETEEPDEGLGTTGRSSLGRSDGLFMPCSSSGSEASSVSISSV